MDPTAAAGPKVARRMAFTPATRPCLRLIVPGEDIEKLTAEQIVADLRTAASLCNLPAALPRGAAPMLPGLAPKPRRQCTLQIVDGDLDEPLPEIRMDIYSDHHHSLSCPDPGQLRAFHKHVVASLAVMGRSVEHEDTAGS